MRGYVSIVVAQLGVVRVPSIDQRQIGVELDNVGVGDSAVEGPRQIEDNVPLLTLRQIPSVAAVYIGVRRRWLFCFRVVGFNGAGVSICRKDNHLGVLHGGPPAESCVGAISDIGVQIDEVSVRVVKHGDVTVVAEGSVAVACRERSRTARSVRVYLLSELEVVVAVERDIRVGCVESRDQAQLCVKLNDVGAVRTAVERPLHRHHIASQR